MSKPRAARPKQQSNQEEAKPGLATRQAAHRLLSAIVDARTPMDALTDDTHGHPHYLALNGRDRALVRAILMAALRYRGDLEAVIDRFTERPLPEGAASLRAILHVAFAQILFLDVPTHSAVDLAVDSARADPRNRRFAPLVNALSRRAARDKDRLLDRIKTAPALSPDWLARRLEAIYGPEKAKAIAAAHREHAPIDLTLREETPENAARMADALGAMVLPGLSLRLQNQRPIADLPHYAEGAFWVQDAAAAVPARLFGSLKEKRMLDLCAAPGGKTAQLAAAGGHVVAIDQSANRLKRLVGNLERLGLQHRCETQATSLFDFEPGLLFDGVLLDAPCSSTGTIRRHPDVGWTKTDADIEKLANLQARMLARASEFVAPGGTLVFSNCSLDPREGEAVAQAFNDKEDAFEIVPVTPDEIPGLEHCLTAEGFVRTTPADWNGADHGFGPTPAGGVDGFFAVRFQRSS